MFPESAAPRTPLKLVKFATRESLTRPVPYQPPLERWIPALKVDSSAAIPGLSSTFRAASIRSRQAWPTQQAACPALDRPVRQAQIQLTALAKHYRPLRDSNLRVAKPDKPQPDQRSCKSTMIIPKIAGEPHRVVLKLHPDAARELNSAVGCCAVDSPTDNRDPAASRQQHRQDRSNTRDSTPAT